MHLDCSLIACLSGLIFSSGRCPSRQFKPLLMILRRNTMSAYKTDCLEYGGM